MRLVAFLFGRFRRRAEFKDSKVSSQQVRWILAGRTTFVVDAHLGDHHRFIMRAAQELNACSET
jgi:hypothetical protein